VSIVCQVKDCVRHIIHPVISIWNLTVSLHYTALNVSASLSWHIWRIWHTWKALTWNTVDSVSIVCQVGDCMYIYICIYVYMGGSCAQLIGIRKLHIWLTPTHLKSCNLKHNHPCQSCVKLEIVYVKSSIKLSASVTWHTTQCVTALHCDQLMAF